MKRDNNVRVCSILLCGSCYLYRSTFSIWRFINRDIKKKLCPYNSTLNLFSDFYSSHIKNLYFFFYHYYFFYFKILYWFCHTSTCIRHGYTRVPHPEPPSHLLHYTIPLGHPSAPASSILYPASNLDWRFVSYMILFLRTYFLMTTSQVH